jgi:hypothetical protein
LGEERKEKKKKREREAAWSCVPSAGG